MAAGVDEDLVGGEAQAFAGFQADLQGAGAIERGLAEEEIKTVGRFQAALAVVSEAFNDRLLPAPHLLRIDADLSDVDTVIGGPSRQVGDPGARNQGFGGRAAHVDAGPSHQLFLDQGGLHARAGKGARQRLSRLA